jgi:phosphate transport system substrate-binding protein
MRLAHLVSIAALVIGLTCGSAAAEPQAGPGVELLIPRSPPTRPQTDAEKSEGMTKGRALPELELLTPALDPGLPAYVPLRNRRLAGHYKAAASDVLPGLSKAWVAAFNRIYPGVHIDVAPPYAGSLGAKELVKGALDFVFVSRELKPDDITDFHARFGYDPTSVPVSGGSYRHFGFLDAIGIIVSKDNPIEQISYDQLDAIYSTTHFRGGQAITTWGQLGATGDWADKPVRPYGVKPWNGFEEFVRQRVLSTPGHRGQWRDDIGFSDTVFPLAGKVAADRYGIAYDGMAYIDAPVKIIPVSPGPGEPAWAPTYENVATADYPLTRLIYFNFNKAPDKPTDPVVREFLRFVLSRDGQAIVRDQNLYMPLRARQAEASRRLIGR